MNRPARILTTAGAFVAAGIGASVWKDRARERRRLQRGESVPFGSVHSGGRRIKSPDGLSISIEVDEADDEHSDPTVTVVFLHGWLCSLDTWHYQRLALAGTARLVFIDHRSHGQSQRSTEHNSSLQHLSGDLDAVLKELVSGPNAPVGPVVLVGHSMGGITIQQLAIDYPDWFSQQVRGVVLLGTSSGRLMRSSPGLQRLVRIARRTGRALDWGRGFNSYSIMRRWALGPNAEPKHIDMVDEMILRAPSHVIFDFYPNFVGLDLKDGFKTLSGVDVVAVVGGTEDQLTPYSHSRYLVEHVDGAELVTAEGAGHMMMFEQHALVSETIATVIDQVSTGFNEGIATA